MSSPASSGATARRLPLRSSRVRGVVMAAERSWRASRAAQALDQGSAGVGVVDVRGSWRVRISSRWKSIVAAGRVHAPSASSSQARSRGWTRASSIAAIRRARAGVGDPHERLDAAVEVAVHHVGAADEHLGVAGVARSGRCASARGSGRGCCAPGCSRTARARPGRSAHIPRTTRSIGTPSDRRVVQRVDDRLVDEVVDLDRDRGGRPGARVRGLAPDQRSSRLGRSVSGATSSVRVVAAAGCSRSGG